MQWQSIVKKGNLEVEGDKKDSPDKLLFFMEFGRKGLAIKWRFRSFDSFQRNHTTLDVFFFAMNQDGKLLSQKNYT